MFVRIDQLKTHDEDKMKMFQERWYEDDLKQHDIISKLIEEGAGEDFLQCTRQRGELPIMDDDGDLRGILLYRTTLTNRRPNTDTFEAFSFDYARFDECEFANASFCSKTSFAFSKITGCTFTNCMFFSTFFYGSMLKDCKFINCDFEENSNTLNCDFHNVSFEQCFFRSGMFRDCCFDEQTVISTPLLLIPNQLWYPPLPPKEISELYREFKIAYHTGSVKLKSRRYYIFEQEAITKNETDGIGEKIKRYFLEYVTGYGQKPFNVFVTMIVTFGLFAIIAVKKFGLLDGILFSAGAFFTSGANADKISKLGTYGQFCYIAEPLIGISLTALFVTVLSRYLFSDIL